ncbi:uncharacterized protein GGS22DRAFT_155572, partial [Annulohypoxylon maeteangense]|uniref:uncharacterized protein n=1 Tax=Annulohypoxylon maeteangense TaxID=1927788 RepID=UPI0020078F17
MTHLNFNFFLILSGFFAVSPTLMLSGSKFLSRSIVPAGATEVPVSYLLTRTSASSLSFLIRSRVWMISFLISLGLSRSIQVEGSLTLHKSPQIWSRVF